MTGDDADRFPVEPWHLRELGLDQTTLAQTESLFALSNGHIGVRGNVDEGDPNGLPGTYLNSFYETRPLPYAESGFGYPESGQTILNVTNGKLIRLLVDDEPFDLRYGELIHHERILDMRRGVLERHVEWCSPAGKTVRVHSTRLVSLTRRSVMAIRYRVVPVDKRVRIVVQSEMVANEPLPLSSRDPRVSAIIENPLEAVLHDASGKRALLVHRTRSSKLQMAAGMEHVLADPEECAIELVAHPDWARMTASRSLDLGESLDLAKFVAYGWSSQRSAPALSDQVDAALVSAVQAGWDRIEAEQDSHLEEFWNGADVEIDGPDEIQQAVRFGIFHTYQAAARAEQRAIPAKGLTGPGYDGHAFWDSEMFVLPLLTAAAPKAAADALRWRHSTIDLARERAQTLRLRGAAFPWRTIRGQECSAYWPAGTAAFHINADIALAAARYVWWTGDEDFSRSCALPLLVETARLWQSLGYTGKDGLFHIDGVTGPDEYSALSDDNTYTNLMAARNLQCAADAAERWPAEADEMAVTAEEIRQWREAAATMALAYDQQLQLPQQARGYHLREVWDFAATARAGGYPLLLHAPYFQVYRKQVVKQADLVLALHWCGDSFTPQDKRRAFDYYEQITVRDSSLSACSQAVVAAEVGHLQLAYDYLSEAVLMDLRDLEHNTRDGVHVASLAGSWIGLVCGFGGLRDHGGRLSFAPRLPAAITRLSFVIRWHGCKVRLVITDDRASYVVEDGPDTELRFTHHGSPVTVTVGQGVELPIPAIAPAAAPSQPAGRELGKAFRLGG
jgi:alpha,alpha-trehalose phosphorylase